MRFFNKKKGPLTYKQIAEQIEKHPAKYDEVAINNSKNEGAISEEQANRLIQLLNKKMGRRDFLKKLGQAAVIATVASGLSPFVLRSLSKVYADTLKKELKKDHIFHGFDKLLKYHYYKRTHNNYYLILCEIETYCDKMKIPLPPGLDPFKDKLILELDKLAKGARDAALSETKEIIRKKLKRSETWLTLSKLYDENLGTKYKRRKNDFEKRLCEVLFRMSRFMEHYSGSIILKDISDNEKSEFLAKMFRHAALSMHPSSSLLGLLIDGQTDCDTTSLLFTIAGEIFNFPISLAYTPGHAITVWLPKNGKKEIYFEATEGMPYINDPAKPKIIYDDADSIKEDRIVCLLRGIEYIKSVLTELKKVNAPNDQLQIYSEYLRLAKLSSDNYKKEPRELEDYEKNRVRAYNLSKMYLSDEDAYDRTDIYLDGEYRELRKAGYYMVPLNAKQLKAHLYFDAALSLWYNEYGEITYGPDEYRLIKDNPVIVKKSLSLLAKSYELNPKFIIPVNNFLSKASVYLYFYKDQDIYDQSIDLCKKIAGFNPRRAGKYRMEIDKAMKFTTDNKNNQGLNN